MSLTWCLTGQLNAQAENILKYVKREGALVPPTWHLEMANVLGLKLRDGNLSDPSADSAVRLLNSLDIATDSQYRQRSISSYIGEVLRFELAAYDALYVELALRTGSPLATFDRAMIWAAQRFGVVVMGVS
jgi:predicted nucleic acid-binding protein